MAFIIAIGLMILNLLFLGITAMTFPGNWLMVATACMVAWWRRDEHFFSIPVLVAIFLLAVIGEVLEFITSAAHVKKSGGSKAGSFGALLGGIVGICLGTAFIPIPIVGTLIGACGGAFAGTMLFEKTNGKETHHAAKLGISAAKGRAMGTVYKFICGVIIYVIIAIAAFWQ